MKKVIAVLCIMIMVFYLSGCALFGNEAQYNDGDWYSLASSREVTRIKQDKLAFEKLKAEPVQTDFFEDGTNMGLLGLVANYKSYLITTVVRGPETKAYTLLPNQEVKDYLIPGRYTAESFRGGKSLGRHSFTVGIKNQWYQNNWYHWYTYNQ